MAKREKAPVGKGELEECSEVGSRKILQRQRSSRERGCFGRTLGRRDAGGALGGGRSLVRRIAVGGGGLLLGLFAHAGRAPSPGAARVSNRNVRALRASKPEVARRACRERARSEQAVIAWAALHVILKGPIRTAFDAERTSWRPRESPPTSRRRPPPSRRLR